MIPKPSIHPQVHHTTLRTTFRGVTHPLSTSEIPISQFRGIKYAAVPARFRQSKLFTSYSPQTDATSFGCICPQVKVKGVEEDLFGLSEEDTPKQILKQSELECLNLNITCPAGVSHDSRIPVMFWIHGGGDRGSGSKWVYDGAPLVQKSVAAGKPIILVTINFRLGLFGFAASQMIRDDNKLAGDEGVGNYGLRDQRTALEWVHHFITDFGGDPHNITLFGESTGAADIISHLLSAKNQTKPLFQRAIVQSALYDHKIPNVSSVSWHLTKVMSALHVSTLEQLRKIDADKLVTLGVNFRATDDGVFFRTGWQETFVPRPEVEPSTLTPLPIPPSKILPRQTPFLKLPANLQPLIIGDCSYDSLLWARPASHWTPAGVVRRLKAVCQSLAKASALLHAYDLSAHTPHEETVERVLELVNDSRVAWPTECIAQGTKRERGGRGVWRYVFDQEGPSRGVPHHAADLIYLFDTVPLPESARPSAAACADTFYEGGFSDDDDDDDVIDLHCSASRMQDDQDAWAIPAVDEWSYARVRDAIQERWIAFANGEAPWKEDKVFVFGPEGETGERSDCIFEGRRRKATWKGAFEPLGLELVQKVGMELSRGPPLN